VDNLCIRGETEGHLKQILYWVTNDGQITYTDNGDRRDRMTVWNVGALLPEYTALDTQIQQFA